MPENESSRESNSDLIIGYSIFEGFEDCYVYHYDECLILDSRRDAEKLMTDLFSYTGDIRIDEIEFADLMSDFALTDRYALETKAYARFTSLAERDRVKYEAEPCREDASVMLVSIQRPVVP